MVISAFTCAGPAADVTHDDNFENILESHVHISSIQGELLLTTGMITSFGSKPVDHLTLAKLWSITHERTKKTIRWVFIPSQAF